MQHKTAVEAYKDSSVSIVKLKKETSLLVLQAFITDKVADLIKAFSVGKSMDSYQLSITVDMLIEDYYFLKISELKYFFTQFKRGHYGHTFDRLDCSVIRDKIEMYLSERITIAQNETHNERFKEDGGNVSEEKREAALKAIKSVISSFGRPKNLGAQIKKEFDVFQILIARFGELRAKRETLIRGSKTGLINKLGHNSKGERVYPASLDQFVSFKLVQLNRVKEIIEKRYFK